MPRSRPPSDRLADLQTRKKQLEAQIAALGAREAVQRRKDDDRRIALLGKILLEDLPNDDALRDYARRRLPAVMRESDRRRGLFADLLKEASE